MKSTFYECQHSSQQLRCHEEYYPTHDLEFAIVVMALRTFQLSVWECGSYLYIPQKLEVHLYPIGSEHEIAKVAQVDQRQ
jgi:hypothetical protein